MSTFTFHPRDLAELSTATDYAHLASQAPVMFTIRRGHREWATDDVTTALQHKAGGCRVTPDPGGVA